MICIYIYNIYVDTDLFSDSYLFGSTTTSEIAVPRGAGASQRDCDSALAIAFLGRSYGSKARAANELGPSWVLSGSCLGPIWVLSPCVVSFALICRLPWSLSNRFFSWLSFQRFLGITLHRIFFTLFRSSSLSDPSSVFAVACWRVPVSQLHPAPPKDAAPSRIGLWSQQLRNKIFTLLPWSRKTQVAKIC